MNNSRNIVEVENVSFSYTNKQDDEVLSNVNLKIHQGNYLGIIGPNGGGKTTLLKLMLGLLKLSSGSIKIFGQDVGQFKDWSKIGYIPQKVTNFDTNFPATVSEVVAMGRYAKRGMLHQPNQEDTDQVKKAISEVSMQDFADRLIGQLSGGQQQKAFIARALVSEPEIIFLDEPTTGIDQKAQEDFYNLLRSLNKDKGITLVVVSHDIDVVAQEVTEIAFINKTLIYDGSPQKFNPGKFADFYGRGVQFIKHTHHSH